MTTSIIITTRNRVEELRRTCQAILTLQPTAGEILITADGCTDGTVSFVKSEVPAARLIVNETGLGSVASRHRMMREAKGDLVLALDDDSYPEQPDCLARLGELFDRHPKLAVATFPQRTDEYPETLTTTEFGASKFVGSFPNSGACFRTAVYRRLPGFEPMFFHMYEEPDYALQCIAAGYHVLCTPIITIRHHFTGVSRNAYRSHQLHARNELWSAAMRCPMPFVLGLVLYRVFSQARFVARTAPGNLWREPAWWLMALRGLPVCWQKRRPFPWPAYRRWLKLLRHPEVTPAYA